MGWGEGGLIYVIKYELGHNLSVEQAKDAYFLQEPHFSQP